MKLSILDNAHWMVALGDPFDNTSPESYEKRK
jgi:hypothetical protein